jgi:putative phosphotransacetylase
MAIITETQLRAMLSKGVPNPFPLTEGDLMTPAAKDFLKDRNIHIEPVAADPPGLNISGKPDFGRNTERGIPVGVSNRHVHLSIDHVAALFGKDYNLTPMRYLSQPGQFACKETVTIKGPRGSIEQVRILGPARGFSQVEVSLTDGFRLGVQPPVRLSGKVQGTPGIHLTGPQGSLELDEGLIAARNHVHMSPEDAERFRVKHEDTLILRSTTVRPIIFQDVVVRVHERYALDFHLDTDEANAGAIKTGDLFEVIGRNHVFYNDRLGR